MTHIEGGAGKTSNQVDVSLWVKEPGGVFQNRGEWHVKENRFNSDVRRSYPAGTDIEFRAVSAAGSPSVDLDFTGYLITV